MNPEKSEVIQSSGSINEFIQSDLDLTPKQADRVERNILDGFKDVTNSTKIKAILAIFLLGVAISSCDVENIISNQEIQNKLNNPLPAVVQQIDVSFEQIISNGQITSIERTDSSIFQFDEMEGIKADVLAFIKSGEGRRNVVPEKQMVVLDTAPWGYARDPFICTVSGGERVSCTWGQIGGHPISDDYMPKPIEYFSANEYMRIIRYFNVEDEKNIRYRRYGTRQEPTTWCNTYVSDVTKAMGVEIPKLIWNTKKNRVEEFTATHQFKWLQSEGKKVGWYEIDAEEAKRRADLGFPTVVAHPDHIAMVIPGEGAYYDGKLYPQISQAGWYNYESLDLPRAFERFFYPEEQEEPYNLKEDIRQAPEERTKIKFFTIDKQYSFVSPKNAYAKYGFAPYFLKSYQILDISEKNID